MSALSIQASAMQLPAHLQAKFGTPSVNDDLSAGVSAGYPIISYKGKTWAVSQGKDRNIIENDRGEPVWSIDVVITKANPNISKVWYEAGYEEGSDARPDCYSNDGKFPMPDSPKLQSPGGCAVCPLNQFGSKITENGAKGKACADSRRLAVAPEGDLENLMLLRTPAASLKELRSYSETLTKRGIPYQAVVTRIAFDREVAYPKLVFSPVRFLSEEEAATVIEMRESTLADDITLRENVAQAAAAPVTAHNLAIDALGEIPAHLAADARAHGVAPSQPPARAAVTEADVQAALARQATAPAAAPVQPAPAQPQAAPAANPAAAFGKKKPSAPAPAPEPEHVEAELVAEPAQPAPQADPVTVLAANAMSGLDAALATLDD